MQISSSFGDLLRANIGVLALIVTILGGGGTALWTMSAQVATATQTLAGTKETLDRIEATLARQDNERAVAVAERWTLRNNIGALNERVGGLKEDVQMIFRQLGISWDE